MLHTGTSILLYSNSYYLLSPTPVDRATGSGRCDGKRNLERRNVEVIIVDTRFGYYIMALGKKLDPLLLCSSMASRETHLKSFKGFTLERHHQVEKLPTEHAYKLQRSQFTCQYNVLINFQSS